MIEKLKEVYREFSMLNPGDLVLLATIAKIKSFIKGDHIIRIGDLNYHAIFVVKGLLRSYVLDSEGNDRTLLFIAEKNQAGSYETILRNKPSLENIVALEDSLVIMLDTQKIDKISKKRNGLLATQVALLKETLAMTIDRLWSYTVLTPEERYRQFCKMHPSLEQRVKQKYLASFLGVTPTSLSRMRARMINK